MDIQASDNYSVQSHPGAAPSISCALKTTLATLPTEMLSAIAQKLRFGDYLNFRLTCRTASKIDFEKFARYHAFGTVRISYDFPQTWTKLYQLLEGSKELARHMRRVEMCFRPPTHQSKMLAFRPLEALPTYKVLGLLSGLAYLNLHGLDTCHPEVQLQTSSMIQGIRASGAPLAKIVLESCNVSGAEIRAILEDVTTLRDIELLYVTCTDGWVRGLCVIAKAENPTLRTVRLYALCPPANAKKLQDPPPRKWLHFLGDEVFEAGGTANNRGRSVLKTMRTPAGIQHYKLTSFEAHLLGRYAINAGIKVILGHMMVKEDLEALNWED